MKKNLFHVYKFATYGFKDSGKTTFLAALAMSETPHAGGATVSWLQNPIQDEKTSKEKRDAYDRGTKWLGKAIKALERGGLPEANPLEKMMAYQFEVTTPIRRKFIVELIDYPGELTDPETSEDVLAKHFRKRLLELDGLFFLAEAPLALNLNKTNEISESLQKIRRSFISVNKNWRGRAPLGVLINKCDRQPFIDRDAWNSVSPIQKTPESSYKREESIQTLSEGLSNGLTASHQTLITAMRNTAGEISRRYEPWRWFGQTTEASEYPEDGLIPLSFVRPISAFGKTATSDANERPESTRPLQSFGLVDALLEIVWKRDAIDLKMLEESKEQAAVWKVWKSWGDGSIQSQLDSMKGRF